MPAVVVPSSLVAVDTAPTSASQVWALSRLLHPDWEASIELATAWTNDIVSARTGAEKRWGLAGKPQRVMRVSLKSMGRAREAWLLVNQLRRMGRCRSLLPLYPDVSILTAAMPDTATIPCDTRWRRFFEGGRIVVAKPGVSAEITDWQVGTITAVAADALTVSGLSGAASLPARVWPLLEADVLLESAVDAVTENQITLRLAAREVAGPSALPPILGDSASAGFSTFEGRYVFDPWPGHDWTAAREGLRRDAQSASSGLSTLYELLGPRPRYTAARAFRSIDREQAWRLLGFFDACCGALRPFWLCSTLSLFDVVAVTSTSLSVVAAGPVSDWDDIDAIAVLKRTPGQNPHRIGRIESVSRDAGVDTIAIAEAWDIASIADIRRATTAHLMRFARDEIVERWTTGCHSSMSVETVEVVEEKDVSTDQEEA